MDRSRTQENGINGQYNRMHCITSKPRRSSLGNPVIAKVRKKSWRYSYGQIGILTPTLQSYTSSLQRAQ